MGEKKKKDGSEAEGGEHKKKKEKSEAGEDGGSKKKKKEKSEAGEDGGVKKKKKEKSDTSEVEEGGKKKKKVKSEASDADEASKKKKKKGKSEASDGDEGSKKKKKKKESSEADDGGKKKKKDKDKSEKSDKKGKVNNKDDELINDILKHEDKPAKVKKLEEEAEQLKLLLKKRKEVDIVNLPPAAKLQAENDYLEAQIRELTARYERLEDKFDIIKKAHKNATEALNHAHTQAMDQEEMEFMRMQLENKRNELAEARNLIRELQKVGWSMLPPKVADESKKTEKELETVAKNVKTAETEAATLTSELDQTKTELDAVQTKYKGCKENGKLLEVNLDEIIARISKTQQEIEAKTEEAKEMETALKAVKNEIEAVGLTATSEEPAAEAAAPEPEPEPEVDPEELARIEEKKRKKQEKRDKRNAEKNESKFKYEALKEEVNTKEEELRHLKKEAKELQRVAKEATMDKNALKKLESEKAVLQKEVNEVKKSYEKEMVLRKMYYNIIEDMLGKVKVYCRVREEKGKEGLQIIDEYSLKVLGAKPQEFQVDKVFGPKQDQAKVFEGAAYLYEQANEGYNTCCFVYGETGAGKTFTCLGSGDEGIMKRGCGKLGELLKKNKKNQLQTRVFTYNIELYQDRIYDLNKNETNSNMVIKRDFYGMVVLSHIEYKECATEDEVKKALSAAVSNRSAAHTKLGCQANQSHFVHTVTIEVGNKFQHKYHKGKVTIIKLAGSDKLGGGGSMNTSMAALGDVIAALSTEKPFIPYKNDKLTMLMQDALGGGAKSLMIACVSPIDSHNNETINTLTYASRVKTIKNEAVKNTDSEEVYKLKNNIDRLVRGHKVETIIIAV